MTRFSLADVERAANEWGCNCGPTSVAAICGLTLDEVRPHCGDFETKHYTNPTLMWSILRSVGARWRLILRTEWPTWGLARVQWEGPWTAPGVPPRVAYRHTHLIGVNARNRTNVGIFDINCINNGDGWVSLSDWGSDLVPWLLAECEPKASGAWHLTHAVEIEAGTARPAGKAAQQ